MKHQIILLGKDITSVYHGIKEFGPDHVHLLCTNETKEVAAPLFPLLPDGIRRTLYRTEPYDGEHVRNVCRKIHQTYPSAEFAYNLSEGTKVMAFAAFTIAKEYSVPAFYLSQLGELIRLDSFEKYPMQSQLDNKEILGLSGNILTEYQDAKHLSDTDVQASGLIKQFIEQIPDALIEAARIDGAKEWRVYFRIVMPNIKPAILTVFIFQFVNIWNGLSKELVYDEQLKVVKVALEQVSASNAYARMGSGMAGSVLLMIPPIVVFILMQRNVVETMTFAGMKD